jgi:hypothetical protein
MQTLEVIVLRVLRLLLLDPSTFNFSSPADRTVEAFLKSGVQLPVASLTELLGEEVTVP